MDSDVVTVWTEQGQLDAELIKGKLESEGIPAFLRYESASRVYGFTMDGLGKVEIQVPVEFAEQARAVLESMDADAPGPDDGEAPAAEGDAPAPGGDEQGR